MTQPVTRDRRTGQAATARRLSSARWIDGRLAVGVLLVLVAVVLGARLFASANHYSRVYVAARALVPGERIAASDLKVGQVRFDGQGAGYIAASSRAPTGYVVVRYVGAGELLPRAALAPQPATTQGSRLVTVPVEAGHLPAGLAHGDLVDVYLTPKVGAGQVVPAPTRVLSGVPVDSADTGSRGFAATTTESVVLDVPDSAVAPTIHAVESGTIDLVRVPAGQAATATPSSQPRRSP